MNRYVELADKSRIEIDWYGINLNQFTTKDVDAIESVMKMLTDKNLSSVKVVSVEVGTEDGEEKIVETVEGVFKHLHAVNASWDGVKVTYTLNRLSDNEIRFRSIEETTSMLADAILELEMEREG